MTILDQPALVRRFLFFAVPILCGLAAIQMGMDANWDLRNYHYYNAWALLSGRAGRDIAVAQIPTFYNPVLDAPYFLLAQWLPARLLAFLLGAVDGLNFILLTLLGERLFAPLSPWKRFGLAVLAAAAGCGGAVALSEIGTVFYDNLLSLAYFASLLLAVRLWPALVNGRGWAGVIVGLPVGLAFGLKLTTAIYAVGVCAALLASLPTQPRSRLVAACGCGLGVVAGMLAGGGYWMWHLWSSYGDPLFPMFNQFFHSPWALSEPYRDTQNLPASLGRRLLFPFFFSFDSRQSSEIVFRDFRILAAFLLLPMAALASLVRRLGLSPRAARSETVLRPGPAAFVMASAAIAYVLWLDLFCFYRYITALEMLAPLLCLLAVGFLPGRFRLVLGAAVVLGMILTTRPGNWLRVPFSHQAVEVDRPAITDPAHTIVLLAGHEPLSFLLPAFPPELRFLRIDSTFTNPDEIEVRFNQLMRQIIGEHQGPLLALFIPTERHDVVRRLGQYGLALPTDGCGWVTSPIGAAPYALCPLERVGTEGP